MRLFHFSDDPAIGVFEPRPVRVPAIRRPGREWLNGPLVWAIDEDHDMLYLFPRECPRILLWPTPSTTEGDRWAWFGDSPRRALAFIERDWFGRLESTALYRYALPTESFEDLDEAGMWVSRTTVLPLGMETLTSAPAELAARDVELRLLDSLTPLKGVWDTSLYASGIRLRNARGWGAP